MLNIELYLYNLASGVHGTGPDGRGLFAEYCKLQYKCHLFPESSIRNAERMWICPWKMTILNWEMADCFAIWRYGGLYRARTAVSPILRLILFAIGKLWFYVENDDFLLQELVTKGLQTDPVFGFALKTMNFVLQMMNCVFKMMHFVFKMMNFGRRTTRLG